MQTTNALLLASLLTIGGCATPNVPVSCPPPAPPPQVLTESASQGPGSMQRFESSLEKLRESLGKAMLAE